jgi:hypothetical protein
VTLPELGFVSETAPSKIKRDDALEMALSASSNSQQKKDKAVQEFLQTLSLSISRTDFLLRLLSSAAFLT